MPENAWIRQSNSGSRAFVRMSIPWNARALAVCFCSQVVIVYLQPFLRNTLCVPRSRKSRKTLKHPILGVQGHSRSLTLVPLKSVSLVLVMICSMSLSICKCFHAIQANSGKKNHCLWGNFSEVTNTVSGGTLNPTHSLTHFFDARVLRSP